MRALLQRKDKATMKYSFFLFLVAILTVACRNEAITYMHIIDPGARCHALNTRWVDSGGDTAVCVSGHEIYTCKSDGPACAHTADVLVEAKAK